MPSPGSNPSATLQRNASFGTAATSALAALVYPWLPVSVQHSLPLPVFVLMAGGAGALLQRAWTGLWNVLLGDLAADAAQWVKIHSRLIRLRYYVRSGVMTPERANELASELVEADMRRPIITTIHQNKLKSGD
jgi:hypothetical protein